MSEASEPVSSSNVFSDLDKAASAVPTRSATPARCASAAAFSASIASSSAATVAHELGHLLGGRHSLVTPNMPEGGVPDPGLMSFPQDRVDNSFSANSIEWFRRFIDNRLSV